MHPAPYFRVEDRETLLAELRREPFVTVAAAPEGRPIVAHAPVVIRDLPEGLALDFHVARRNRMAPFFAAGFPAVMASLGPHAYVSADWYENPAEPSTWNYILVEAEGLVAPLEEIDLIALLDDLSAQEEAPLAPKPAWVRERMPPERFEMLLRGIVGGRLWVERLEGTFKLSQNKSEADRASVIAALGDHPLARRMS
ncbi:MAG TPA: FMN-binding negative transcriptional regulator [Phenylobacterium sp.]|nr:FMN-binding negative transcriptional regulator [Phenylobacterium sp.]